MKPTDSNGYPFVGFEYEYMSQPVKVTRIVPCPSEEVSNAFAGIESRFGQNSTCDVGEFGTWMVKPPTAKQIAAALDAIETAKRGASSDEETELLERQEAEVAALATEKGGGA